MNESELSNKIQDTFLEKYPVLAKKWFFERNEENKIFPENYTYGSSKKCWWKCSEKKCHIWEATIKNQLTTLNII